MRIVESFGVRWLTVYDLLSQPGDDSDVGVMFTEIFVKSQVFLCY